MSNRWVEVRPADEPSARPLRVCNTCARTRPCTGCGLPAGPSSVEVEPGRLLCPSCLKLAVRGIARATELYDWVRQTLTRQLGLRLDNPPRFALVTFAELNALAAQVGQKLDGSPGVHGLFAHLGGVRIIAVLVALPQIEFVEVCAHELGHAWQHEVCPGLIDPELREGFAQWVAYKLLQAMQVPKPLERMLHRTDVYGNGLRRMLTLEAQWGSQSVLLGLCQEEGRSVRKRAILVS